ncbi:MAG: phosphoribosylformylglycinamidine synthase subunit PurQ, partial [Anaerolineae bacterium]
HINELSAAPARLHDFQMLVLPGGFSFGDDLGAGKLWALELRYRLGDALAQFHAARRPILGICNGFQALVKTGFLPGPLTEDAPAANATGSPSDLVQTATLTRNAAGHFECRWVHLRPQPDSVCVFTRGLDDLIFCPVAHGEGRFELAAAADLPRLQAQGQIALTYVDAAGAPAAGAYPLNPNGSLADIAGICDRTGTIFGLMPHPEDHLSPVQHPAASRGLHGRLGLALFANGIRYAGG